MTPQEAAAVVNGAVFHPLWKLTAEVAGDSRIVVTAEFRTFDSSDFTSAGRYWNEITMVPTFEVETSPTMDEDQVLHRVLRGIDKLNEHEAREFLRVRRDGEWVAPFHPHNLLSNLTDLALTIRENRSR